MRNLTEFLLKHFHWLLFVLLEVFSVSLLLRFHSYHHSIWFSTSNSIAAKVLAAEAEIGHFFLLSENNRQLTERNVYLERRINQLQKQATDTFHHHTALKGTDGFRQIPAQVISNSVNKIDNLITINKGSADGVQVNMGVVSGTGIVGVVYLVGPHNSIVLPILNSHSNISCSIAGTDYFGYLHWNGGYRHMAYVDDIPRHARFRPNDFIVTSGYSSIFPSGLMVGQIKYVFNSPDGLSYRLKIKLATDFANLRDVVILDNSHLQEQIQLLRAAEDSLKINAKQ